MNVNVSDEKINMVSNEIVHYRYSSKPIVVATVDVPKDENVPCSEIINFLQSEGIIFDYLTYDTGKSRYCVMLNKNGFERCEQ